MPASFRVYIDESGNTGFGAAAGDWFVLAAMVTRVANDVPAVSVVNAALAKLWGVGKSPQCIHATELSHERKVAWMEMVGQCKCRVVAILVNKRCLDPSRFNNSLLYSYTAKLLLERVTRLCHDHHDLQTGDGTADIYFSQRHNRLLPDIITYTRRLRKISQNIKWSVVREPQIHVRPTPSMHGLQVADAIAHAFWASVQMNQFGHVETRYAWSLRRVVHRGGESAHIGCGIKIYPDSALPLAAGLLSLGWKK